MRRLAGLIAMCLLGCGLGVGATWYWLFRRPLRIPDPPALITQMREVARLETLEVTLYKKVSLEPDPPIADTLWGDVANWVKFTLHHPHGRAIVFADAHVGFDLTDLVEGNLRVQGDSVEVVLPKLQVVVELRPGETEVMGSNLDSQETAQLFELARAAFEQEVKNDRRIRQRARASAQRHLTALLGGLGFKEVRFVEALAAPGAG